MSDKKNDTSSYISIGTVRARIGKDGGIRKMFFSPTDDFSVSHVGEKKEYVTLLPAAGNSGCGVLSPYDSKKGLRLNSGGKCAGLVKAAIKQCAVEIEVVAKCKNCPCKGCKKPQWSLRAITIPAGARTK